MSKNPDVLFGIYCLDCKILTLTEVSLYGSRFEIGHVGHQVFRVVLILEDSLEASFPYFTTGKVIAHGPVYVLSLPGPKD